MAKTRDNYQITGATVEEVKRSLNFILQRMADRMDKMEGIRGTASIESNLEMNQNRVTEVADAVDDSDALNREQADLTGAAPTFASIAVTGEATFRGDVKVYDSANNLIHSLE